ncbi:MAG: hypothetical protein AAFQ68_15070, partial [Bacteroidota bacterium]
MNNKLLSLLRTLQTEEQRRFDDFLHSPYFNKRERSIQCWHYFWQFAPNYDDPKLNMDGLASALFSRQKIGRQVLLDEISFLYRQLKAFCEAEALQQSPFLQRSLRLRQLNDRGLDRLYEIERKAATKLLDEQAPDQEERYKFELEWATLDNEHFGRRQARTLDDSLAHKLRAMEVYFLTLLLRESGEALNRQHILSVDYELPLLSPLLSYLSEERQAYREKPLIELYFLICKSLQTEATDEDYQNLLLGLRRHRSQLSVAVARTMYKYAQNFCIRQINRGQERYQQALFDLFQ